MQSSSQPNAFVPFESCKNATCMILTKQGPNNTTTYSVLEIKCFAVMMFNDQIHFKVHQLCPGPHKPVCMDKLESWETYSPEIILIRPTQNVTQENKTVEILTYASLT